MQQLVPDTAYSIEFDDAGPHGHAFGRPPGLRPEQWPLSRINGRPMAHLFTVLVPEQYRCAGPDLVAISLFQADDHVADEVPGVPEVLDGGPIPEQTPFWTSLQSYRLSRHPEERFQEDDIGGGWVWIWRTEAELAAGPCPLPDPATALPGYASTDGIDAWASDEPARRLRLEPRTDDPNVGRPYREFSKDYVHMYSPEGERLRLAERFWRQSHFGGTVAPPNGGDNFGPCFVAFDQRLGNPNLGGDGTAQLDLANEHLQWSCG